MKTNFHSNGKLLLTGEYVVLDGAKALAVPTKFGQSLSVSTGEKGMLSWKSLDEQNQIWFQGDFRIDSNGKIRKTNDSRVSTQLKKILLEANRLNPKLFSEKTGFGIVSHLEFPQDWGLGSSSTLINNIAEWFQIDAYQLLEKTFGGSGYDIACAKTNMPITYQLIQGKRIVSKENFGPTFKDRLFFVHLNRKQNSREAVLHYKNRPKKQLPGRIKAVSQITEKLLECERLEEFGKLLWEHERIISSIIKIPTIKEQFFPDFPNTIKSLGGWGGDFVLAIGGPKEKEYFRQKGFSTILSYSEMVLG